MDEEEFRALQNRMNWLDQGAINKALIKVEAPPPEPPKPEPWVPPATRNDRAMEEMLDQWIKELDKGEENQV